MKTIQMISLLTTKIRSSFQRWGAWLPLAVLLTLCPSALNAQTVFYPMASEPSGAGNLGDAFLYNIGTCVIILPNGDYIAPGDLYFCGGYVWPKVPASGLIQTPYSGVKLTVMNNWATILGVWDIHCAPQNVPPGGGPGFPPDGGDGPGCGGGGGSDNCQNPPGCNSSGSGSGSGCCGMPVWSVSQPYSSLWLHDEPLGYKPSIGPQVSLRLAYKQRDLYAGFSANHFSMGKRWNFSWLSYVIENGGNPEVFFPGGGQETFTTTNDYLTNTRLSGDTTNGFTVTYPNGSENVYGLVTTNTSGGFMGAYMTEKIDPESNMTTLVYYPYDPTNDVIRLEYIIDADGRTNFIYYATANGYSTNLIAAVVDPFGRTASMEYDPYGDLTNLTDVNGNATAFAYSDVFGTISNMTTPYGTTTFSLWDSGDPNVFDGRSVLITQPDGGHQLYMYSQSPPGFLNSYPASQIPQTPFPNTFDTDLNQNDSFYWGPRQYAALSTTNISAFTRNDYLKAKMSHWLLTSSGFAERTLGAARDPSPDSAGTIEGMITWYDYADKTNAENEGTQIMPWLEARVLPDGTTWFERTDRNSWGKTTDEISTYSANGVVALRTNTYAYADNGIDLIAMTNALGVQVSSKIYNGYNEVVTNFDALGEMTTYTYDGSNRLTSTTAPNGLVTTNIYGSDGFLAEQIVVGYSTNYFTYTNALAYTQTDPHGVTTTNTWDNLNRLTSMIYPDGTCISNRYTFLDLTGTKDRMGNWTYYGYDSMRREISETNANGAVTFYNYCTCGSLESVVDPLGNITSFGYDNQGNMTNTVSSDGYSVTCTYDLLKRVITSSDSSGSCATNWYNNQGLMYAVSNAYGRIQFTAYDILDRATNAIDANGVSIEKTYDILNRPVTCTYPDGGVESYGYTPNVHGPTSYTNQIGNVLLLSYDGLNRKTNEVTVGATASAFTYDGAGDLLTITDGKNQTTAWNYDQYGRKTNKVDAAQNVVSVYGYDDNDQLTNRWTPAKGTTTYQYDSVGNLTRIGYEHSPPIILSYDANNRLTNMVDGLGTTAYSYDQVGQLLSEGGLWPNDTVNYTYQHRLRQTLSLAHPGGAPWTEAYGYDVAWRLTNVDSPAGNFGYTYDPIKLHKTIELSLPNGAYITNTFDSVARLLSTTLVGRSGTILDSQDYAYNVAGQRVSETNTVGDYRNYTYNNQGELTTAIGKEANGQKRLQEQFGYAYDAAGNLNFRTNNALIQTFNVNSLNQLTTVTNGGTLTVAGTVTPIATNVTVNSLNAYLYNDSTFAKDGFVPTNGLNTFSAIAQDAYGRTDTNTVTVNLPATNSYVYDLNGNLLSDGSMNFAYDDENELISVWTSNAWSNSFAYDGKMRRRIERDYSWNAADSQWTETNEVHFIYDGNVVVEERSAANIPLVSYTRGNDLGGSSQSSGGVGTLLARTTYRQEIPGAQSTAFYHADGDGNITALIYPNQQLAARYLYDPYGRMLAMSGPLMDFNKYRFSSEQWNDNSGLYYYGCRFYDPGLQKWINRDPLAENGGLNLYAFTQNNPINYYDILGMDCNQNQCNSIDLSWGGSSYEGFGGSINLAASVEICSCCCPGRSVDAGVSFSFFVGIGVGDEVHAGGFEIGWEIVGPQLGSTLQGHFTKECGKDGVAFKAEGEYHAKVGGELTFGEDYGVTGSYYGDFFVGGGLQVDESGAEAFFTYGYDLSGEVELHLGLFNYTHTWHLDQGGKTIPTPPLKW